jgi:thermitase
MVWRASITALGVVLLALVIGSGSLIPDGRVAAASSAETTPSNEVIVKFKSGVGKSRKAAIHSRSGGLVTREIGALNIDVVEAPAGQQDALLARYLADPSVKYAEINGTYEAIGVSNDASLSSQWQFNNIGQTGGAVDADIDAFEAWDVTDGSPSITIAILDTGIDQSHEDLAAKIVANANFSASGNVDDFFGHGTHVAGSASALSDNGIGVAGTCPQCSLMNVKVLADDGTGDWADIADGIVWATDHGAHVINLSLGDVVPSSAVEDAVNYAWAKGVVVVAAAGNDGEDTPFFPASYENVIAVAATDQNDNKAGFSQYGSWVDVAAPGANILSTAPDHFSLLFLVPTVYGTLSGTSMASPHVAGIAGLVWSTGLCGNDNACVRDRIESRADATPGTGLFWVHGRVNALRSVSAEVPPPEPIVTGLSPSIGLPAGGTEVTISGLRFDTGPGATSVQFGSQPATEVSCSDSTTCTATSPAGAGAVHVTVTVAGFTSTTSSASLYTYGEPPCSGVTATPSPASPQEPGATVSFDAVAEGCSEAEYRFWLLAPGSGWQMVQDWSSSASWAWDTTGLAPGSYLVSVWVRAVGSTASYEAYVETPYELE